MNMLTTEFNLDEFKKVIYSEGMKEGEKEGEKRVLELMAQGLNYEEIKKKLEKNS